MLIKESTLRRIIREEARRVLSEDAVGMDLMRKAHDASIMKRRDDGTMVTLIGARSPFSDYMNNVDSLSPIVQAAEAAVPADASTKGKIYSGFVSFLKSGSQSPIAPLLIQLQSSNLTPQGKARAALAIFGGHRDLENFDAALGIKLRAILGGAGMSSGETERKKIDAAIKDPAGFVSEIIAMASFDVAGETKRALAKPGAFGQVTGVPEEMEVSSPPVTAPQAASPKSGMTWGKFVSTVKGGQQIKSAWDRYALASVPPLNVNDYSLFKKWWDGYRKKNPGWAGSPVETVAALGKETAARRTANKAG